MPAPVFRDASAEDWPAIAALLAEVGLPEAGAADHVSRFVLAVSDDGLVGCAGLEAYGPSALLRSVAVKASARGTGLGAALVTRVLDRARAGGVRDVILLTETAPTWFPRFGFEPITRAEVPEAVKASAEFRGACCASASVMRLVIRATPAPLPPAPVNRPS